MTFRTILVAALAGAIGLAPLAAQPKQPKIKSKGEAEAINAIFTAPDPDARIAAVDAALAKYADTEFKSVALQIAAQSAQEKNDYEKMVLYAERTLEADPKNYACMLMLAQGIALRTREFDLDREEKLGRAEKYAKDAIAILATAEKPRPDIPDEQWTNAKKDYTAQGHEALAAAALARKKHEVAVAEYKNALDIAATPDPATMVRYAAALNSANKPDEALVQLNKLSAMPELHPAIRSAVASEKIRANQLKAKAAPAAAPSAATPPPAAPPKQQ